MEMPSNTDIVIAGAARTPIGRFLGGLSGVPAPQLGAVALRAAIERAGLQPADLDGVIMGNVIAAGLGMAPARQVALGAGCPPSTGAITINKACGSGLMAVILATQAIRLGDAAIMGAGGMESMSLAPYLLPRARTGFRYGHVELQDAMLRDGLWCAWENHHMGSAAEAIAAKHGISRAEQDAFALRSHQRAVAAIQACAFAQEIVPVETVDARGRPATVATDECPRGDTSEEALARLKPVFKADGTVTAGNASQLADGAAAVVVISAEEARRRGLVPLARITGYATAGVEPLWLFDAPVEAIRKLLRRTGTTLRDYDLIELNEAFAAQVLADGKQLEPEGWDWERVNVRGGAVALGHPIGCSGARVLVTLLYALRQTGGKRGLACLCLGGGEAVTMAVETL
jgi:acetyl-CoA C-acetyltransferase